MSEAKQGRAWLISILGWEDSCQMERQMSQGSLLSPGATGIVLGLWDAQREQRLVELVHNPWSADGKNVLDVESADVTPLRLPFERWPSLSNCLPRIALSIRTLLTNPGSNSGRR